jgi:hypothetical protein
LDEHKRVVGTIYSPKEYYTRVPKFLRTYKTPHRRRTRIRTAHLIALSKSIVLLGVVGKERIYYWKLFCWSLFRRPGLFATAVTYAIYGFHFRKIFERSA